MQASNFLRKLFKRSILSATKIARATGGTTPSTPPVAARISEDISYTDELTKHQTLLQLYDIAPIVKNSYVAPSATLVGEVAVNNYATVWNNVVIRGDINYVYIGSYASIGDNTVIQTVASLPTGLPAM